MPAISTVLVVEDDDDLRDVITYALQSDDVHVVEVEDGDKALEHILTYGLPDLMLLDNNMPVMTGTELAQELRRRELWTVPVIVMTAANDAEHLKNEIGAAGALGKPFELRKLLTTVSSFLHPEPAPENGQQPFRR